MSRTIIVRRKNARMVAEKAVFSVYIDGNRVFSLNNGEAKDIEISDEEHTIQVINDTTLDKETGEKTKHTQFTDVFTIPAGNESYDFLMQLRPLARRTLNLIKLK